VSVLVDDRDVSAGVKLADADLDRGAAPLHHIEALPCCRRDRVSISCRSSHHREDEGAVAIASERLNRIDWGPGPDGGSRPHLTGPPPRG
jgi:hypothetical protein